MKPPFSGLVLGTFLCVASSTWAADQAVNPIGRFDIVRFQVEGNSLLSSEFTQRLLAPYAGKARDFADVQRALETLEQAYHQRGYSVVQVILPEQELNQGVVRLQVIEPRIDKVTVAGNRHASTQNVRASLPALQEGRTPNIGEISNNLRVANESPFKKTNMQLKTGERDGEINAVLTVEDEKPWTVGINLDNTGNESTGEHRVGVVVQHANIAGRDHVLSLQYTTTIEKPSQVSVYGVGYRIPFYALGDSLDLFASYSDVNSGIVTAGVFDLQISGKGAMAGVRYNQTLGRRKDLESKLIYGFDYKAYQNNVALMSLQLGNDVTVRPLSLTYSGLWTGTSGQLNGYLSANYNLAGGDKGDAAAFNLIRQDAPANYKLLRYGLGFSQVYSGDWQMRLGLSGQYARDALIPGEQFGAGGASSVRGYSEREIADDSGNFVTAEIYTPNLCRQTNNAQCRLLGFVEAAHVTRNHPLPGEQSSASIGSVGVGLRFTVQKYASLQLDYGHALKSGSVTTKGSDKLHFRLSLSY